MSFKNPWSAKHWNLTTQGAIVKRHGSATAERMAKAAGTTVGAGKPADDPASDDHKKKKVYVLIKKHIPAVAAASAHEFLGFFGVGPFANDQQFALAAATVAVSFPTAHLPDRSQATCGVAASGSALFFLVKDVAAYLSNGTTVVATATFLAGQTTGNISYNGPNSITVGEVLYLVCPHVADPTIQDVELTFCGDPV